MALPMTKSALALAKEAYAEAQASLPSYGSVRSRKTYTLHQLFAILVLRQFFTTDYRASNPYAFNLGMDSTRILAGTDNGSMPSLGQDCTSVKISRDNYPTNSEPKKEGYVKLKPIVVNGLGNIRYCA